MSTHCFPGAACKVNPNGWPRYQHWWTFTNNTARKRADVPSYKQFVDGSRCFSIRLHLRSNQLSINFRQFPVLLNSCKCEETIRNSLAGLQQFAGVARIWSSSTRFVVIACRVFSYLGMHEKGAWLINWHRQVTCFPLAGWFGGSHRLNMTQPFW